MFFYKANSRCDGNHCLLLIIIVLVWVLFIDFEIFCFKIRVQIFEGRHLPGSNINPLVRVTVAGQRQQTSIKHSTNRPIYTDAVRTFFVRKLQKMLIYYIY